MGKKLMNQRSKSENKFKKGRLIEYKFVDKTKKGPQYLFDSISRSYQLKILNKLNKLKRSKDNNNLLPPRVPSFNDN